MESKKEIAGKLLNIFKPICCEDCPLDRACDVIDSETNQGSLCAILKETKENADNE
jgi:hypothetical protein